MYIYIYIKFFIKALTWLTLDCQSHYYSSYYYLSLYIHIYIYIYIYIYLYSMKVLNEHKQT